MITNNLQNKTLDQLVESTKNKSVANIVSSMNDAASNIKQNSESLLTDVKQELADNVANKVNDLIDSAGLDEETTAALQDSLTSMTDGILGADSESLDEMASQVDNITSELDDLSSQLSENQDMLNALNSMETLSASATAGVSAVLDSLVSMIEKLPIAISYTGPSPLLAFADMIKTFELPKVDLKAIGMAMKKSIKKSDSTSPGAS